MQTISETTFDLLVIGGGINGLGVAADAAARGLSVCLIEKTDFGGGTTGASSRLIHGGLRYLQYGEVDLVRESLRERGLLVRQRPHLVRAIDLAIPVYEGEKMPRWMVGAGLTAYDLLARDALFPKHRSLSVEQLREREPGLSPIELTGGYLYPDAQVAYPERLCVELAQETVAAGGVVRARCEAVSLLRDGTRVAGANVRDSVTGEEFPVFAALTINATGPWVDKLNDTLDVPVEDLMGGTWGTHLVLPAKKAGPRHSLYAAAKRDGRPFFLLPWDDRVLVGTTDVKYEGDDPGRLSVADWEVDYLLEETNRLFPLANYTRADVLATTIGVRPLPKSEKSAGAITRRHALVDHSKKDGLGSLISLVGGKLTTYRSLAEEVVDFSLKKLGRAPVATSTAFVPDEPVNLERLRATIRVRLMELRLPQFRADRLMNLYGSAAMDILERVARTPALGAPLSPDSPDMLAQAVHAVRSEFARTPEDVVRRRLMRLPAPQAELDAVATLMEGAARR